MQLLRRGVFSALALCAVLLLPAQLAGASVLADSAVPGMVGAASSATPAPTDSASPSGPVDPGTGETAQSKQNRVDYAPYVLAGVLILTIAAVTVFWRRRKGRPSQAAETDAR